MSNLTDSSTLSAVLSDIQRKIILYAMPLMLFFGSGGNLLNCTIFLQKTLRSNSCSIYLITSSLFHTLVLTWGMSTSLYTLNNQDPLTYSIGFCKIRLYFVSSLFMISRSCVVLACIDRYALCSPNASIRKFCSRRLAFQLIAIIILIWFILPIHIIIFSQIEANHCIMPGIYSLLYGIYTVICAGILPPSFMIIFSLLAYFNLRHMHERIVPASNPARRLKKTDYQIMKMLFVEVIIYCISTFPFPMNTVYAALSMNIVKNRDRLAIENFLTFLAGSMLLYVNASTTLYSNLITSSAFRQELKKLVIRHVFGLISKKYTLQPTATVVPMSKLGDRGGLSSSQQQKHSISRLMVVGDPAKSYGANENAQT